jgi:hypothetical protein
LIRIRIDVDYPYPSRIRSFMYTALNLKLGRDYLKNSKIAAKMISESVREAKAYWFFTPKTIPDEELLTMMNNPKHEVALHIVNDPVGELQLLEKETGRKIRYYTIHGTARLLARIMWRRWKSKAPKIPKDFPLQSFQRFPTTGIDSLCYLYPTEKVKKMVGESIKKGEVIYFHPIWLFQRGKLNHRGPFYEVLSWLLDVPREPETLVIQRGFFFRMARDMAEYMKDISPSDELLRRLHGMGADIFTFLERRWCFRVPNPQENWAKAEDNVALLYLKSYDEWWKNIGKKTRNMIRKAEKSGITTDVAEPNEKLAEGVWKIYNETPIRQERGFPHYGISLQQVITGLRSAKNCTYIGAHFQDELAGFIQLFHGENTTIISQILSLQKHWDKAVNNALVAKVIEVCASKHFEWIMYGRIGNHPTLDNFKQNNGFTKFHLTRYFIPLTKKGRLAIRLGLHREMKDALPQSIKYPLIPLYNWISRTKVRVRLSLKPRHIK